MHPASTAVPAISGGNVNGWRSLPLVAAPLPQLVVEELPDDFCNKSTYRFHPTPSEPNGAIRVEQRIATKKAPMKGASPYPSQ